MVTYQDLLNVSEALKSGKYKKAKGRLRTSRGYCVQGVACEVIFGDNWIKDTNRRYYYCYETGGYKRREEFRAPMGLNEALSASLWKHGITASVVNDDTSTSFLQMSKTIESFVKERIESGNSLTDTVTRY